MASITTRTGKGSPLTNTEVDNNFTNLNTELGQKEVAANKGVAGGYASLDGSGKVPSTQLPSYVDDVVEGANLAAFPGSGETGKIYVALDTNKTYRWSGSAYVEISASPGSTDAVTEGSTNLYFTNARARAALSASGSLSYNSSTGVMSFSDAVTSVAGRTGAVTLTSSDVGLGNVENKSSATIRGEITSGNVTTALGYTPYNATNPSGYITSSALSSYLPLSGGTLSGALSWSGGTSINDYTGTYGSLQITGGNGSFDGVVFPTYTNTPTVMFDNAGGGLYYQGNSVWGFYYSRANGTLHVGSSSTNQVLHAGNYTSYAVRLQDGARYGTNLNTILNSGFYNVDGGGTPNVPSGTPGYGQLIVARGIDTAMHLYGGYSNDLWYRGYGYGSAGDGFYPWRRMLHDGNYSSYALPLSGGLLTGSVGHQRGTHNYFERSSGINVGAVGWHTDDYFYVAGHPSFGPSAGNDVRVYAFGNKIHLGSAGSGDVLTIHGSTSTFNGAVLFSVPSNSGVSFTNSDLGNAHYTNRGNRYLTSNGANWLADGTDVPLVISSNASDTVRGRHGIVLHNESNNTNAFSPAIAFGSRSASGDYNSAYAFIQGRRTGNGVDANWNSGELHFYAASSSYMADTPSFSLTPSNLLAYGNVILHAGNYSSYALPLSGGDMTGRIRMGTFAQSQNNTGEAWIGRAADRSTGTMTVQLGNSSDRTFEVVDNAWSIVIFNAGMNSFLYKNNAILHAGNYSSYALPLSGGTITGTLTFANNFLRIASDNSDWGSGNYFRGTNNHFVLGVQSGGTLYLNYGNSAGTCRIEGTTLINGNTALHAANYNSYSPTLTGGGASGTWGINITGNAATVSSLTSSQSAPAVDYTTPSDASGYTWIRIPYASGDSFNSGQHQCEFYVTRAISFNGSNPYGGCTAKFTLQAREWHNGQEMVLVQYGEHGSNHSFGQGFYITNVRVADQAGNGYWIYLRVRSGITYRFREALHGGAGINFGAIEGTSDPGSSQPLYYGLNLIAHSGTANYFYNGNAALHAGNYNSYALPLSAGSSTWTANDANGYNRLTISNGSAQLGLFRSGNSAGGGYIGFDDGAFRIYSDSFVTRFEVSKASATATVAGNAVLHAANYNSYALPLSGGTLTGTFTVNTNANQVAYFQSPNPNTWVDLISTAGTWSMGATASNRWAIYNRTGTNGTRFEVDTSAAYVNGNTVLHAGNYGSYALPLSGGTLTGQLTINNAGLLLNTGGVNTYGVVSGYPNNNHLITLRGQITGSVTSPSISGAHQMTFVEYAEANDSSGWYFKSSQPGTYTEVARITRSQINWNGNTVLHAGNYTSYSPSLGGSGATGTWGINITGSAGSAGTSTRGTIEDTRAGQRSPNAYDDFRTSWEFTNQIIGGGDWHSAMTMQGWHDGYAAWQIIGPASTSAHENFYLRSGVNTSWNPVRTIVHSGNSASYPSGSISGYNNPTTASTANTIAYRTSNGDVSMRELILTGGANSAQPGSNDMVAFYPTTNQVTRYTTSAVAAAIGAAGVFNTPSGYVSNGNPWGTSNSAFFPNGITTANTTNWIYGHCYLGNAPSNGSGAQIESNGKYYSQVSSGVAMHVRSTRSSGETTFLAEQNRGDHSWGIVGEFRVGADAGTDRPSVLFSSGYNSDTWSVGFGYVDSNFRINRDHGYRNGNWGTTLMTLDRSGNVTFAGNVTAYSDRRLKQNIKRIGSASEIVRQLEGVSFEYIEDGRRGIGLIAQDVELVLPELVGESTTSTGETYKNVAYSNIVAVLIEAVKELQVELAEVKGKLH